MLTSHNCRRINEMKSELKYIQGFEETRVTKEKNIFKAVCKQQRLICHDFQDYSGTLDEFFVVSDSDSHDNAIAEWILANLEYLPHFMPVSTKQSFGPVMLTNQVQFTASIQHTASRLGGEVAVTGVGSVESNSVGFAGGASAGRLGGAVPVTGVGFV